MRRTWVHEVAERGAAARQNHGQVAGRGWRGIQREGLDGCRSAVGYKKGGGGGASSKQGGRWSNTGQS